MVGQQLTFRNGDKIDAIGLGTWKSNPGDVYKAVREAIKDGYRHLDCAYIYGNEEEIGNAIKDAIKEGDVSSRKDLFITSKLWNAFHTDVLGGVQQSLKALQLDYLDLYLIHWPVALKRGVSFPSKADDFLTYDEAPLEQTWANMEDLVEQGLVKHIGVSNFNIPKLKLLIKNSKIKPEMNQVECHPLLNQQELLDFCNDNQILFTAYSPLGSRDRPSQFKAAQEPDLFENSVIKSIAQKHKVHPAAVLIRWAVLRGTSVIPKSINPQRIQQNFNSANSLPLDEEDMKAINQLNENYRYVTGTFWETPGGFYTADKIWNN